MTEKTKSYYDDLHFKLGRIVVAYNMVEHNMIGLISNLINCNDRSEGAKKCAWLSASQMLELLKKLVQEKVTDEEVLNKFDILYSHLKEVIQIRNGFMHSMYLTKETKDGKLHEGTTVVTQIK